jgi:hypothetical protein
MQTFSMHSVVSAVDKTWENIYPTFSSSLGSTLLLIEKATHDPLYLWDITSLGGIYASRRGSPRSLGHALQWCVQPPGWQGWSDPHLPLRRQAWYVQNVSTFPNPFAVVFPIICVFWIQLTQTNIVFSRIALVSPFCAEIQLSGKFSENIAKLLFHQRTHGTRRWDREEPRGAHTTWWRGPGQATPGGGVAASAIASSLPSAYIKSLTWK